VRVPAEAGNDKATVRVSFPAWTEKKGGDGNVAREALAAVIVPVLICGLVFCDLMGS
jgi:hypothetical protein